MLRPLDAARTARRIGGKSHQQATTNGGAKDRRVVTSHMLICSPKHLSSFIIINMWQTRWCRLLFSNACQAPRTISQKPLYMGPRLHVVY